MKVCISIALSILSSFSYAQSPKLIEKKLRLQFMLINYWSSNHDVPEGVDTYDSLVKYNDLFAEELLKYTSGNTATLTYNFKNLIEDGLIIADSDDGLFRIYSWNTLTGGTMRIYSNVFQYKSKQKVSSIKSAGEEDDPGSYYLKIHTLNANGKTYYLGVHQSIYSSSDLYQSIKVFAIGNNTLDSDVKLIKTKSGLQNELGFEYNFLKFDDIKRPVDKLVTYDKIKKTLSIPVVSENLQVTNKDIIYTFTGKYFEKLKK